MKVTWYTASDTGHWTAFAISCNVSEWVRFYRQWLCKRWDHIQRLSTDWLFQRSLPLMRCHSRDTSTFLKRKHLCEESTSLSRQHWHRYEIFEQFLFSRAGATWGLYHTFRICGDFMMKKMFFFKTNNFAERIKSQPWWQNNLQREVYCAGGKDERVQHKDAATYQGLPG